MTVQKRTSASKRTRHVRDVKQTDNFLKDWVRLEHSGRHDMNRIKEAMLLLIANDAPMPPEWKDHALDGNLQGYRECHVKGDLLLLYHIEERTKTDLLVFMRACTHSELFAM